MSANPRRLRVLQLDPAVGYGVRLYRVQNLAEQLSLQGCGVRALGLDDLAQSWARQELDELLRDVDLVVLHRFAWDLRVDALLRAARRAGVTTVFESDDLVFVPGAERWVDGVRHLGAEERALYDEGVERYAATHREADAFMGSTAFLAGLRPATPKPSIVVPNVLGEAQLRIARKLEATRRKRSPRDEVVIGYGAGSRTHDRDLAVAGPALARVLEAHPRARLELVGPLSLPPELADFEDRVRRHELQSWQDWWAILATWDVALAPLDERNPYCRAKSALKFLEAGVLGVATVASPTDDFARVIDDGRTGRLASTTDEWFDALDALVDDDVAREAMAVAARDEVLAEHTTRAIAAGTVDSLRALIAGETSARVEGFVGFDLACLVPSPFPGSGGHSNVFRALRSLGQRGHVCTIHADINHVDGVRDEDGLREFVDEAFLPTGARFRAGWNVPSGRHDAVLATSWATAEAVDRIESPSKLYFVQDWECMFVAAGEDWVRTERTYELGHSCITLGRWLTRVMRTRYGADSVAFPFPVHIEAAQAPKRVSKRTLQIAFLAQPSKPRRGYRTGVEALALLHESHPEVSIVFFGSSDVDPVSVPFPFEDRGILDEAELEALYAEVDIGLVLSYSNPSLVPPNMMRCGCVVVDVDLEHNEYEYEHEVDSLLAEPTPWGIASALSRLVVDEELRSRLRVNALAAVADRSEEGSVDAIESALVRGVLSGQVQPHAVMAWYQGECDGYVGLDAGAVTQQICVEQDGLYSVSLRLGTYARAAGDVVLRVREVLETQSERPRLGAVVAGGVWHGTELVDNQWHRLEFEPIADSAGRSFAVEVAMADSKALHAAVYVLAEGLDASAGLSVAGTPRSGVLQLKAHALDDVDMIAHWRAGESGDAHGANLRDLGLIDVATPVASVDPVVRAAPAAEAGAGTELERAPASATRPAARDDAEPELDAARDPRVAARRLGELMRARAQRAGDANAHREQRVRALEAGLHGFERSLQRARSLLHSPLLGRPLRALKLLGPTEHFIEGDRFVTPELRDGLSVGQRVVIEKNGLCGVAVRFGTDGRALRGDLSVSIREDQPDGEVLRQVNLSTREIRDNQFAEVSFAPIAAGRHTRLVIELTAKGVLRGSGPRVWGRRTTQGGGVERLQDGRRAIGALDMLLRYGEEGLGATST